MGFQNILLIFFHWKYLSPSPFWSQWQRRHGHSHFSKKLCANSQNKCFFFFFFFFLHKQWEFPILCEIFKFPNFFIHNLKPGNSQFFKAKLWMAPLGKSSLNSRTAQKLTFFSGFQDQEQSGTTVKAFMSDPKLRWGGTPQTNGDPQTGQCNPKKFGVTGPYFD